MIVDLVATAAAAGGCNWWDPICVNTAIIDGAIKTVADETAAHWASVFMNGWAQLEMMFFASWVAIPLLASLTDPNGVVRWLQDSLAQVTWFFAILGAVISAGWTFFKLRAEKIRQMTVRMAVLLLISTSGGLIVAALDQLAHLLAIGLLTMVGVNAGTTLATNAVLSISPALPLVIGAIATLGLLIQYTIMIGRGPLVMVLLGLWPLSAAAATLGVKKGTDSFDKITSWLLAFVIYPFPAAVVYAAAFKLKSGSDGLGGILYGFALEMMALFVLPAVMRIIAPQVQALGRAYGGEVALKTAAAVAETAVAVGAAVVTAGAAAGLLGAKLGTTVGSKATEAAAQQAGQQAAKNVGRGGGAGPDAGGAPQGGGETRPPISPPAESGGGASTVDAGNGAPAAPPTPAPAPAPAPDLQTPPAAPGPNRPAPNPSTTPPASRPARSPQRATSERQDAAAMTRRMQAAAQAAQVTSASVNRATRQALEDIDETIGGKHD